MPELRSRSPRSGGSPGVRIALGLPQTDAYHRLFAGLDQQQGTLVAWLSLTSWRSCLAPGFCGFLEEATLHTKVSHSRIHQAVSSYREPLSLQTHCAAYLTQPREYIPRDDPLPGYSLKCREGVKAEVQLRRTPSRRSSQKAPSRHLSESPTSRLLLGSNELLLGGIGHEQIPLR